MTFAPLTPKIKPNHDAKQCIRVNLQYMPPSALYQNIDLSNLSPLRSDNIPSLYPVLHMGESMVFRRRNRAGYLSDST